jgi:hypothetical protein
MHLQDDEDYLSPEQTETVLRRVADLPGSVEEGRSIGEVIADLERDPRMKALMGEARVDLRKRIAAGERIFEVRELELTERGLRAVSIPKSR